ncbi:CRISPR-associated helicase/endonuclease Cas3 [Streptomyces avicenniae]|uniref:CRISPR-associated helicase/endonuclease Cas3 n=1 Tax=Streptomyces avicenniae TaxID=500153 RepID=UPI00069B6ADE|nr:CRISPR-associated helicase/endonuclease Cas3 [Streptomyces avicenniae]
MAADPVRTLPARPTLTDVRAKSKPKEDPERLTAHLRAVHDTVAAVEARVARAGVLAADPGFWRRVRHAALLHDTGKIAAGFQRQLLPGGEVWGERHEVLSLAYVDLLAGPARWSEEDRLLIASLVATHHVALLGDGGSRRTPLVQRYNEYTDWAEAFTRDPRTGEVQVTRTVHRELLAWLAGFLAVDPPPVTPDDPPLAERARAVHERLVAAWRAPVKPERGLLAVLAQGALTLADHAGSAHEPLQTHLPLLPDYLERQPHPPYDHQRAAAGTSGHLVLVAPTGSGKTEAGLAWAARQVPTMPGLPRVVWTLPYRASLNAARERFRATLTPPPGGRKPDIGLLHGAAARRLLTEAVGDDCAHADAEDAKKAKATAGAMRLFAQRMRVATPHQLLFGAIAGASHSSVLLEQANSLFVLDELHAYEPRVLGRICAAMGLWERLGSRVAVLSATLAPPVIRMIDESLTGQVTVRRAPQGTSPVRHRLVLDESPITSEASLDRLRCELRAGYSVLAVVNRVRDAQRLFAELADDARDSTPGDPHAALLLHSRFKHRDRDAIEKALLARHPERTPDQKAARGGLVVATQTVEVSLQLDFDRGAVENAPIEAVAQRAGRVNRRGLHPEGPVEFRVHAADGHLPYQRAAVEASWTALHALTADGTDTLSEEDIDRLLETAYATEWGEAWIEEARAARDAFADNFLTFTDPFHDRSEFADRLSREFDTVEVLHEEDREEYARLSHRRHGDALLASRLLIPLGYGQARQFGATYDRKLKLLVVEGEYDAQLGLRPPPELDTVV